MSRNKNEKELSQIIEILRKEFGVISNKIGRIQIGNKDLFPFGWRKAAKGRSVWRILEECINQQLENSKVNDFSPSESEVGVFDFKCSLKNIKHPVFVNIKSSTKGIKKNKDDISKAKRLLEFYENNPDSFLLVASFEIEFHEDMSFSISNFYIMPVNWIPDIYVNPSNNANLQSSKYKDMELAIIRSNKEFTDLLKKEIMIANEKRKSKT